MGISNFSGGNQNNNNNNGTNNNGNNNGFPPGSVIVGVPGTPGQPPVGSQQPQNVDIDDILINYNEQFKNVTNDILFRDTCINQTLSGLIGKNKPNVLLIGPAGVGKTKIVEDIAHKLAVNNPIIPDSLQGATIYELPLSNIVAGSSFVGQVEEKIKAVIYFMENPDEKKILFIDEIHQLCGRSETYKKIAQILKPALARGTIRVIGATTLQESNELSSDPAFNRRFSRVIVDEFTKDQTLEILKQARTGFIAHYKNKISVSDDILEYIAYQSDDIKTVGSHRPDNALTLLDRAMGDTIIARKVKEKELAGNPTMLQALQAIPVMQLTERQVKSTAFRMMTGNSKQDAIDFQQLSDKMNKIQGQDDVLSYLKDKLRKREKALYPKTTPLTWLFIGPSGVGKSEIAKIIASELTGGKPIILNMTEYNSPASINRIIGAPAGYVGSDSNAELPFDCLESNPYQVILLDEFEKCDSAVQTLFMSAFESGTITTSRGKEIDFSKSIIIATTNAGYSEISKPVGFLADSSTDSKVKDDESLVSNLINWFKPELLNRFEGRIVFHEITKDIYRNIVIDSYHRDLERIRKEHPRIQLPDDIPDDELDAIVKDTYIPAFGARPAGKAIRNYIEENAIL